MKICFITNLYPPNVMGGAELYVEKLVKKIAEDKKQQIIVITTNQNFSFKILVEKKENIKIYRLWPFNLYSLTTKRNYNFIFKLFWHLIDLWNPFVYFTIKKILKKEKPDLVHTHNLAFLSFSVFSAIKSEKIKLIHTCHDYYPLCPYANLVCPFSGWRFKKSPPLFCKLYRQITKLILKNKVNIVLMPSKFVMRVYLKNGFFINSQKIILPLAPNINLAKNHSHSKQKDEIFKILYVGQLTKAKGIDVLIKAVKNLKLKVPNLTLTIIGTGKERKKLEKLTGENKNIIFIGRLRPTEIQKKYQETDVIVIPSLAPETFSLVMFEAMANGKLVIASKIGALAEYIKDNENGFLFEPGNIDQLQKILEKVIHNPLLMEKIGQNAQKFAQDFTFQKHWKKLEKIYQSVYCQI
ncbi:MAG: glycosyltransferase family 4 protein [Patescibacteria group bacterium]